MQIIKGDILNIEHGIVCHQVNCMGKMGAGIALAIRRKWPIVYEDYINAYRKGLLKLGYVVFSEISKNKLYVASLCGQYYYGRIGQYTNYVALGQCLEKLAMYNDGRIVIYFPKGMSCTLAGGDWHTVSAMIDAIVPDAVIIDKS